jgi:2-hydroxychromene-2-carboxylate isomerase
MSATIEFIFDFGSPNAYLAYRALPPILKQTGARLVVNPCLLGGIFKATGNQAPMIAFAPIKGKFEYEMLEVRRFVATHRLDKFRLNPHFPVNTLMLMRGLVAAQEAGSGDAYLEMGLKGMWEEGLKLDDPEALARSIDEAGLDSASLLAAAQTDLVKRRLADNTAAAVARGVFGIPTFFIGAEMFFGKERLGQVEQAVESIGASGFAVDQRPVAGLPAN